MRTNTPITFVGLVGVTVGVAAMVSGCPASLFQITSDFDLAEGMRTYDLQAEVPVEHTGTYSLADPGVTIGSGSLAIPVSVVSFTPADTSGGKGAVNLQQIGTIEVTAWIASPDELDTVCGGGEEYGPFTIALDENSVPVSISPSSITLTQNTLSLLNGGEFTLCIRAVSTVDGILEIELLRFRFGL